MASKMFTGDMPELMGNILNNLNNEFYSLYSCTLVSRHWCKMSIPILWQDPFSFEQNSLFISKYFSALGKEEKFILKECGIDTEFSKTLFDYARFLKVLDLSCLERKVKDLKLINSSKIRIINLLIKLFAESGATLLKLDLSYSYYFNNEINFKINSEIFYSLGRNEQLFSQLRELTLSLLSEFNTESTSTLLSILAKSTTKIIALKLDRFNSRIDPQLFQSLIRIIKSQQLRLFSIVGEECPTDFCGIISALKSQTNTLQEITIDDCVYNAEFEVLKNCKKLETLRIRLCDAELFKTLDYKISTLEIVNSLINESAIVQILQNSGLLLQRLRIVSSRQFQEIPLLLETIKSFCPNIIYLNFTKIKFSTQLLELISNLQKLQFLTLYCIIDTPEEDLKIQVMQFAKILPLTLHHLDLWNNPWLDSYIDIFLNHCNAPLKKLLIYRLNNKKHTKALIEFFIRKRSLNYVGVKFFDLDYNIKKEVEGYFTLVPSGRIIVNC